jgi:alpha-L-glutamate ligase-like protein
MKSIKNQILTNNFRISQLILKHNLREDYPIVDNKILTAQVAKNFLIPTPENYFFIESHGQLANKVEKMKLLEQGFVVKPAEGSQGGGILIVERISPDKQNFVTGRLGDLTTHEFIHYLYGILSGLYSLKGHQDKVLVQEKIQNIPEFVRVSSSGIPDIRVIVFLGFPLMAMIRFPTELSGGRGNLHVGAVGSGIDLRTGTIIHSIQNNSTITEHPDTGIQLKGMQIPRWQELLKLASQCSEIARIGYLGVDLVIDKNKGPLLLEMNARPGLSIQLANKRGLLPSINKITKEAPKTLLSAEEKVKWSLENLPLETISDDSGK